MKNMAKRLLVLVLVMAMMIAPVTAEAKTKGYTKKAKAAYQAELKDIISKNFSKKAWIFTGDFNGDKTKDLLVYSWSGGIKMLTFQNKKVKVVQIDTRYGAGSLPGGAPYYVYYKGPGKFATPHDYGNTAGTSYTYYLYYKANKDTVGTLKYYTTSTGSRKSGYKMVTGKQVTSKNLSKVIKNLK